MSIKAMNWAMEQATGDPRAQCLLYVIADCANEEGVAWPGADWMAAKSQQSRATVYRRLDLLQESGLLVTFPRWIDENGKIWNAAATGRRRTSPEIRLQLGVFIKQSAAPDEAENIEEPAHALSQVETGVSHYSDDQISQQRQGSSHCGDDNHHSNHKEDSPQPPSGGTTDLEGWKEFEADWGSDNPILRQSLAQQVWASLKPTERDLARQAARGYGIWLSQQKRPPTRLAAHRFLKERDAWDGFAKFEVGPSRLPMGTYAPDSAEAKAVKVLHEIAQRTSAFFKIWRRPDGTVQFRKAMTPQLLALAKAPDETEWVELERNQAGAWEQFLDHHFDAGITRHHPRAGSKAPWPWPPKTDGTIYTATGPPHVEGTLMTEEDYENI